MTDKAHHLSPLLFADYKKVRLDAEYKAAGLRLRRFLTLKYINLEDINYIYIIWFHRDHTSPDNETFHLWK